MRKCAILLTPMPRIIRLALYQKLREMPEM